MCSFMSQCVQVKPILVPSVRKIRSPDLRTMVGVGEGRKLSYYLLVETGPPYLVQGNDTL